MRMEIVKLTPKHLPDMTDLNEPFEIVGKVKPVVHGGQMDVYGRIV